MFSNTRSKVLFAAGALVLGAAAAGIVVLAALTTWWALFALLALCPLMGLVCGAAMVSGMGGRMGSGLCGGDWCAAWMRGDAGRATPTV
jgi:cation transporter-like permease